MDRKQFLEDRKKDWRSFHQLLATLEKIRSPKLTGEDVSSYSRLYRSICYDLATVRSRQWGSDVELFLNDLVTRGHNAFYGARPRRFRDFLSFLMRGFPRLLRDNHGYFWLALVLFVLPGLIAAIAVVARPELANHILPGATMQQFDMMYSEAERSASEEGQAQEALATGFYVYNNIGIAFTCFATGVFFGIGTVFYLVFNSVFLGAVTGYIVSRGHSENFFSFVISHGSFELTAIVVAGAAGLILGHALLKPGPYRRMDALRLRAGTAVRLATGAGVMLGIAAIIEGFWSPSGLPSLVKYAGGTVLWILVAVYLVFAGRRLESP